MCPLGFTVVCGALSTQGSGTSLSSELAGVTGGPASGEGLQLSDDDELEVDEELSGGDNDNFSLYGTTKKHDFLNSAINMPVNLGLRSSVSESKTSKCFSEYEEKGTKKLGRKGKMLPTRYFLSPPTESHPNRDERKKKRGKGKRRNKSKSTTAFNPEHTFLTSGYTSTHSSTDDPCTTTHLGYCIHGYCKYIEGLSEPVCM